MAKLLTEQADAIKSKKIAIMTIDADLLPAGATDEEGVLEQAPVLHGSVA